MENKFQKIETENYILVVSDEEIKEGDLCYDMDGDSGHNGCKFIVKCLRTAKDSYWNKHTKKIIAYQPKGNAKELEGLPLILNTNVEDYSLDAAKKFALSKFENLKEKYPEGKGVTTIQAILDTLNVGVECGYKFASKANKIVVEDDVENLASTSWESDRYNGELFENGKEVYCAGFWEGHKAATKVYSEEDLRKAMISALHYGFALRSSTLKTAKEIEDNFKEKGYDNIIIQTLKQPKTPCYPSHCLRECSDKCLYPNKTPKWFVAEVEIGEVFNGIDTQKFSRLKTTKIEGKNYLVGKWE